MFAQHVVVLKPLLQYPAAQPEVDEEDDEAAHVPFWQVRPPEHGVPFVFCEYTHEVPTICPGVEEGVFVPVASQTQL
jgi:hypothetical protein